MNRYKTVLAGLPVGTRYDDDFFHAWAEWAAAVEEADTGGKFSNLLSHRGRSAPRPMPLKTVSLLLRQLRGVIGCQQTAGQSDFTTESEVVQND